MDIIAVTVIVVLFVVVAVLSFFYAKSRRGLRVQEDVTGIMRDMQLDAERKTKSCEDKYLDLKVSVINQIFHPYDILRVLAAAGAPAKEIAFSLFNKEGDRFSSLAAAEAYVATYMT